MRYEDLNHAVISRFPELEPAYRDLKAMYQVGEEPGPHVVYGDVLNPHLIRLFKTQAVASQVQPLFDFLEELASSPDQHIQEVVSATVCERLNGDRAVRAVARRYMGPRTLQMAEEVERAWG